MNETRTAVNAAEWIARGQALAEAATPGPWDGDRVDGITQAWTCPEPWQDVLVMEGSDSHGGCNHHLAASDEDVAFIADARTRLPLALDALTAVLAVCGNEMFDGTREGRGHNAALADIRSAIADALGGAR